MSLAAVPLAAVLDITELATSFLLAETQEEMRDAIGVGEGGELTDHGGLSGLSDDDHPQYYNQARGDARYALLSHTHAQSSVTDLVTDLAAKAALAGANFTGRITTSVAGTSNSQFKAGSFELQSYAVNNAWLGDNAYFDGSNFKRRATGKAGLLYFYDGESQVRLSGTSDAADSTISNMSTASQFRLRADGSFGLGGSGSISGALAGYAIIGTAGGDVAFGGDVYITDLILSGSATLGGEAIATEPYVASAISALGLGTAATRNVGTTAGTVAAGDDSRLTDQRTPTDGSVTNAKLAASAITGQAAETTIDDTDLILLYDSSATALRKMTRANFVAGLGGGGATWGGITGTLASQTDLQTSLDAKASLAGADFTGAVTTEALLTAEAGFKAIGTNYPASYIEIRPGQYAFHAASAAPSLVLTNYTNTFSWGISVDNSSTLLIGNSAMSAGISVTTSGASVAGTLAASALVTTLDATVGGRLQVGQISAVQWNSRTRLFAPADGALRVANVADATIFTIAADGDVAITGDLAVTGGITGSINASQINAGTLDDARIPSGIARDSEVTTAISALSSVYQAQDADLTSLAALGYTSGNYIIKKTAAATYSLVSLATEGETILTGGITGQTAETTISGDDLVLIWDDSASAVRKMTRANFVAGISGGSWGSIPGTLTDQTDLVAALSGKADTSHSHAIADVTDLQAALDARLSSVLNIVIDGTSIVSGYLADFQTPFMRGVGLSAMATYHNIAVPGHFYSDVIDHFPDEAVPLFDSGAAVNLYLIDGPTNDLHQSEVGPAVVKQRAKDIRTLAMNAGYVLAMGTIAARDLTYTHPWFSDWRDEYNAWLLAEAVAGGEMEGVIVFDWNADYDATYSLNVITSPPFLFDGTHFDQTGSNIAAGIAAKAVRGYLFGVVTLDDVSGIARDDARLTDSRAPSGSAGGDLSGTYPNPQIAAGAIVNADINASAAIALSKLATDPLARANHTGTQTLSTISDAGNSASRNVGTSAGTVCAGDDSRLTDARTPTDDSVTNTKLAVSAITGQTAETSISGDDLILIYDDSVGALRKMTRANFVAGISGGSPAWGAIGGTLSDQTDLQTALNAKAALAGATFTGSISATNLSGTNTGDQDLSSYATTSAVASGYQPLDADLTGLAGLGYTSGAYLIKKTAAGTYSLIALTTAGENLLDDADASAQRTTLGLGGAAVLNVGTSAGTVAAGDHDHSGVYQPADAELTALAGLTSAADKGIQFTGAGTAGTFDLTTAGKNLLDDADAAAQRTTLGLSAIDGSFFDVTPADGTLTLIAKAGFAFTINAIKGLKTSSGSLTLSIQINGTNVTGLTSLSVTTSAQDATATAANVVAVGDRVTAVISASSSPANLEGTLQGTR